MSEYAEPTLPSMKTPARQTDWAALGMGLFLLTCALVLVGTVPILALLGLSAVFTLDHSDALMLLMLAAGMFALGVLLIPGVYFNARKFFNLPETAGRLPEVNPRLLLVTLFAAWLISILAGYGISRNAAASLFLLPFINVVALFLPIGIVLTLGLQGLPLPAPRRAWSLFGASAILGPSISIFFELFAVVAVLLAFARYASSTPGIDVPFQMLVDELQNEAASVESISQQVTTLLLAPGTTIFLLALFALAVPIIEETFKVFLLWFYAGRLRSPVEGFVLGALSGAAFALAENISFSSVGAEGWAANALTRATAALPHIFNSALMGWALAAAWQKPKPGSQSASRQSRWAGKRSLIRLAGVYLAVVFIHGTWNALSVALALTSMSSFAADVSPAVEAPSPALIVWGVLIFGLLAGLFLVNQQLRKQAANEAAEEMGYNPPSSS